MKDWNNINSEKFIKALKSGDEVAFSELYSVIILPLTHFLIKQFENFDLTYADAEEVANDTMLKVSKAILNFDSKRGAKLTTWIFDVAVNQTRDFIRSRNSDKAQVISEYLQREKELKAENERLEVKNARTESAILMLPPEIEQETESKEVTLARQAFDALTKSDQDIIRMRRVMEYEDIAKVENKAINALRIQHKRAMDRLKINFRNVYQKEYQNEQ